MKIKCEKCKKIYDLNNDKEYIVMLKGKLYVACCKKCVIPFNIENEVK